MQLSREREAELLEQNMPKIYRAIDNFMARCDQKSGVQISYDDCVQEVSLSFLQYIRRCETEVQLDTFPWYDAMHAMSELVLVSQPLTVPLSTHGFSEIIHSLHRTVSFDVLADNGIEVDGMSRHWVPDTETRMDFDDFMTSQSELDRRIASMRLLGMTYRDIAAECGVSKSLIDKKIRLLKDKYDDYFKEDQEDEGFCVCAR